MLLASVCMGEELKKLLDASWLDHEQGIVFLKQDWVYKNRNPPLYITPGTIPVKEINRAPLEEYGKLSGYFIKQGKVTFFLWPEFFPNLDIEEKEIFVAGSFNDWGNVIGDKDWRMVRSKFEGQLCFKLEVPTSKVCPKKHNRAEFKFVTADNEWQPVPLDSPNRGADENGSHNFILSNKQTGKHVFYFKPEQRHAILGHEKLLWKGQSITESINIAYGHLLADLQSDGALGSFIQDGMTIFRIFAPRATAVHVSFFQSLTNPAPQKHELQRQEDSIWEKVVPSNLDGWFYHYSIDGENEDNFSMFNPDFRVLDPYALASVGRTGPGIIIDHKRLPKTEKAFQPPSWHDLVIMETHVRDLVAKASTRMTSQERRGFAGVAKWLRSDDCYLVDLGINAVELQPVQQNDSQSPNEYHWGYMTTNFFAPDSGYGTKPEEASQIEEFKDMVDAFHERNMAVLLDVVYNHVGEPAHLLFIDKEYYFETNHKGDLMNWSGCGNDLKANAPMARRLIIDSLIHLVETYDVDGFRFDLAELLGVDVLREIERELKRVKPSIILIAEPWSFRGHIAQALRHTGWASWNDGYRDFAAQYVRGHGTRDTFKYFLSGSPHYFAMFPAQTVNYTASHDDRCWLDRITENRDHNGSWPTINDRRRTHIMAAFLFSSLGIPMLAAGQDFLHSKQGVNNTYQRGDLNALDYQRIPQFPGTHQYFKGWIHFRLSERGRLFRLDDRQTDHYLNFFESGDTSSIGVLFNADHSQGDDEIFAAFNPHHYAYEMPLDDLNPRDFMQIADHERFEEKGISGPCFSWDNGKLRLPPMSCGLWISK
ncbi:alpha-amylase family glycosyl hydrolase [Rubellicoccus peritrichatus]|uniref:Alpha-amylase family glycosyl hydrolase n=1 Tax=Rubellicoccus peritrichatus TaxID=3080537 RepID=A0AAQ3L8Z2_9BACT|nr:alpha-amylase family glycosyl hydrolase [Puniceicoccus sp. CR14]WOO41540.1 alpha-amylase family glycosyl hydrolase [Puniceicoccus sp. CR14]